METKSTLPTHAPSTGTELQGFKASEVQIKEGRGKNAKVLGTPQCLLLTSSAFKPSVLEAIGGEVAHVMLAEANNGLVAWYRNRWRNEVEGRYTDLHTLEAIKGAIEALGEGGGEAMRMRSLIAKEVGATLADRLPIEAVKRIQGVVRQPTTAASLDNNHGRIVGLLTTIAEGWDTAAKAEETEGKLRVVFADYAAQLTSIIEVMEANEPKGDMFAALGGEA